jgi:hypothetical protein
MVPGCGWVNPTHRNKRIMLVRSIGENGGENAKYCKKAMVLCNYISINAILQAINGRQGREGLDRREDKPPIDQGFRERPS